MIPLPDRIRRLLLLLSLCAFASAAAAQSLCSSDGQPQPVALLERFINADCEACWSDPATPKAGPHELALDWVLPGAKGDDAPLSPVARRDALATFWPACSRANLSTESIAPLRTLREPISTPDIRVVAENSMNLAPAGTTWRRTLYFSWT
ncbi:MAG: hypothetical protein ACXWJM_17280, partial [Ramlibacter sp.]